MLKSDENLARNYGSFLAGIHQGTRNTFIQCIRFLLQKLHSNYLERIKEVKTIQDQCIGLISKQRYRLKKLTESIGERFVSPI